MAFAAIHPDAGRIDATLPDLGCGLTWEAVYRVRPRVALRCPGCGHGVHAKVSSRKLRHFAHDPGRPADCAWSNESPEHHLLKLELVTAVRAAGWYGDLEVRAPDGTWRADVLGSSPDGTQHIAWEAQLSPITDEDIQDRTARYQAAGIGVCWVSPAKRVPWIGHVPSIRVREPDEGRPWSVVDGVAAFDFNRSSWYAVPNVGLTAFVGWVLRGQTITHPVLRRYRRIWFDADKRLARRHLIWTTTQHIETESRHEAMRQRQETRKRQREEQERAAEQRRIEEAEARQREEEAQRQEQARQRELEAAAARARHEERLRQWAIKAEEEERQRQEQARAAAQLRLQREQAAEQERLQREEQEYQAACRWWAELSLTQLHQLHAAITDRAWTQEAVRVEIETEAPTAEHAYGIPVHRRARRGWLYGILRPSPASLHRLPDTGTVFVRNAREAKLLIDTGHVDPARVVHFELPDHEQMSLM